VMEAKRRDGARASSLMLAREAVEASFSRGV
jgi:hypothetical protein